jgi:hypothetical protein
VSREQRKARKLGASGGEANHLEANEVNREYHY